MVILTHLLARQVCMHKTTPDVLYITGWDDYIQMQVCWIVVQTYTVPSSLEAAYSVTCEMMSNPEMFSWLLGLAYIECEQSPLSNYDIDLSMAITRHQYDDLITEAQS